MLGDAENPTPSASQGEVTWKEGASSETGSVDSSTQAAVTSGAGQTRDEQAGGEEHSEGAVVGAANTTDAADGANARGDLEFDEGRSEERRVGKEGGVAVGGAAVKGRRERWQQR